MRMFAIVVTAIFAMLTAMPADAAVTVIGNSNARSCYLAARASSSGQVSLGLCDSAIRNGDLTEEDRMASLVNRGILHYLRGDPDKALRDYDAALAIDPKQPEAWLNKGFATLRKEDAAAAIPMFDTAVANGTIVPALAHFARATAYEEIGDLRAARADYRRARDLAPKWGLPVRELSRFQVRDTRRR